MGPANLLRLRGHAPTRIDDVLPHDAGLCLVGDKRRFGVRAQHAEDLAGIEAADRAGRGIALYAVQVRVSVADEIVLPGVDQRLPDLLEVDKRDSLAAELSFKELPMELDPVFLRPALVGGVHL